MRRAWHHIGTILKQKKSLNCSSHNKCRHRLASHISLQMPHYFNFLWIVANINYVKLKTGFHQHRLLNRKRVSLTFTSPCHKTTILWSRESIDANKCKEILKKFGNAVLTKFISNYDRKKKFLKWTTISTAHHAPSL